MTTSLCNTLGTVCLARMPFLFSSRFAFIPWCYRNHSICSSRLCELFRDRQHDPITSKGTFDYEDQSTPGSLQALQRSRIDRLLMERHSLVKLQGTNVCRSQRRVCDLAISIHSRYVRFKGINSPWEMCIPTFNWITTYSLAGVAYIQQPPIPRFGVLVVSFSKARKVRLPLM